MCVIAPVTSTDTEKASRVLICRWMAYMGTPSGANVAFFGPNIFGGLLGEGVGAGIRQGDADLKAMFDKAIAEAAADGTIGRISTQYFGKDLAP